MWPFPNSPPLSPHTKDPKSAAPIPPQPPKRCAKREGGAQGGGFSGFIASPPPPRVSAAPGRGFRAHKRLTQGFRGHEALARGFGGGTKPLNRLLPAHNVLHEDFARGLHECRVGGRRAKPVPASHTHRVSGARGWCTRSPFHKGLFSHKDLLHENLHEALLHKEPFARESLTQGALCTRLSCTRNPLHEALLHKEPFAQGSLTQGALCTRNPLHEALLHK